VESENTRQVVGDPIANAPHQQSGNARAS
jgi:hypothetical protein